MREALLSNLNIITQQCVCLFYLKGCFHLFYKPEAFHNEIYTVLSHKQKNPLIGIEVGLWINWSNNVY